MPTSTETRPFVTGQDIPPNSLKTLVDHKRDKGKGKSKEKDREKSGAPSQAEKSRPPSSEPTEAEAKVIPLRPQNEAPSPKTGIAQVFTLTADQRSKILKGIGLRTYQSGSQSQSAMGKVTKGSIVDEHAG